MIQHLMLHTFLEHVWKDTGNWPLPGEMGDSVRRRGALHWTFCGSIECPIMCLYYFFKSWLWGWLPNSAMAIGGLRALRGLHFHLLRHCLIAWLHMGASKGLYPGPHSQGLISAFRKPSTFLVTWNVGHWPVSPPPALTADPNCVRPYVQPQGGTSHTFIKVSRDEHVVWFWPS